MDSKAKILGHGMHPILIVFPLGLLATAAVFDIVYLIKDAAQPWTTVSYWMIAAGIVGGLLAASTGWIDWFAIPTGTRAKSIGLVHGAGNAVVLLLFALSWWLRHNAPNNAPDTTALALSFLAVVLALGTGWLGGELVERLGVSVHDGAHLDAPSSLSGRPATERK